MAIQDEEYNNWVQSLSPTARGSLQELEHFGTLTNNTGGEYMPEVNLLGEKGFTQSIPRNNRRDHIAGLSEIISSIDSAPFDFNDDARARLAVELNILNKQDENVDDVRSRAAAESFLTYGGLSPVIEAARRQAARVIPMFAGGPAALIGQGIAQTPTFVDLANQALGLLPYFGDYGNAAIDNIITYGKNVIKNPLFPLSAGKKEREENAAKRREREENLFGYGVYPTDKPIGGSESFQENILGPLGIGFGGSQYVPPEKRSEYIQGNLIGSTLGFGSNIRTAQDALMRANPDSAFTRVSQGRTVGAGEESLLSPIFRDMVARPKANTAADFLFAGGAAGTQALGQAFTDEKGEPLIDQDFQNILNVIGGMTATLPAALSGVTSRTKDTAIYLKDSYGNLKKGSLNILRRASESKPDSLTGQAAGKVVDFFDTKLAPFKENLVVRLSQVGGRKIGSEKSDRYVGNLLKKIIQYEDKDFRFTDLNTHPVVVKMNDDLSILDSAYKAKIKKIDSDLADKRINNKQHQARKAQAQRELELSQDKLLGESPLTFDILEGVEQQVAAGILAQRAKDDVNIGNQVEKMLDDRFNAIVNKYQEVINTSANPNTLNTAIDGELQILERELLSQLSDTFSVITRQNITDSEMRSLINTKIDEITSVIKGQRDAVYNNREFNSGKINNINKYEENFANILTEQGGRLPAVVTNNGTFQSVAQEIGGIRNTIKRINSLTQKLNDANTDPSQKPTIQKEIKKLQNKLPEFKKLDSIAEDLQRAASEIQGRGGELVGRMAKALNEDASVQAPVGQNQAELISSIFNDRITRSILGPLTEFKNLQRTKDPRLVFENLFPQDPSKLRINMEDLLAASDTAVRILDGEVINVYNPKVIDNLVAKDGGEFQPIKQYTNAEGELINVPYTLQFKKGDVDITGNLASDAEALSSQIVARLLIDDAVFPKGKFDPDGYASFLNKYRETIDQLPTLKTALDNISNDSANITQAIQNPNNYFGLNNNAFQLKIGPDGKRTLQIAREALDGNIVQTILTNKNIGDDILTAIADGNIENIIGPYQVLISAANRQGAVNQQAIDTYKGMIYNQLLKYAGLKTRYNPKTNKVEYIRPKSEDGKGSLDEAKLSRFFDEQQEGKGISRAQELIESGAMTEAEINGFRQLVTDINGSASLEAMFGGKIAPIDAFQTGNLSEFLARIVGARAGGRLANEGGGPQLVISGAASKRARAILNDFIRNPELQAAMDEAMTNPVKYAEIMKSQIKKNVTNADGSIYKPALSATAGRFRGILGSTAQEYTKEDIIEGLTKAIEDDDTSLLQEIYMELYYDGLAEEESNARNLGQFLGGGF